MHCTKGRVQEVLTPCPEERTQTVQMTVAVNGSALEWEEI